MAIGLRPGCLVQLKDGRLGQLQSCQDQCRVVLLDGEVVTVAPSELSAPNTQKPMEGGGEASFDLALGPQTSDEVAKQETKLILGGLTEFQGAQRRARRSTRRTRGP